MGGQSPMFFTGVLLAVLISPALAGPWAIICAGKSSNEIRTCDSHGCGQYTAQRNQRLHQGVDVLCSDGSTVYAPFTGMIVGQEKPFKNRNAINNGVRISGRGPTYRGPSAFTHPPCGKSPHSRRHNWNEYTEQLAECWRSGIAGLLGFCIKMFYIKPVKYKGSIKKGEKLGTLLPLQKVYPGIQSHVHIENCDLTDPTVYL
uniref:Leukocyte cell derived chemotaxin 2 n=1 Tax=Sus scrofa TaxID=9823 RepID=A0A8D1KYA7_PIG